MQTLRRRYGGVYPTLSKSRHRRKRLGTKEAYNRKKSLPLLSRLGASKIKSRKMKHAMNVNTNSPTNVNIQMVALKQVASNSVAASRPKRATVKKAEAQKRVAFMQDEAKRVSKSMVKATKSKKKEMHKTANQSLANAMSKLGF